MRHTTCTLRNLSQTEYSNISIKIYMYYNYEKKNNYAIWGNQMYNNQICKWGKIQGSNKQMSKYARN